MSYPPPLCGESEVCYASIRPQRQVVRTQLCVHEHAHRSTILEHSEHVRSHLTSRVFLSLNVIASAVCSPLTGRVPEFGFDCNRCLFTYLWSNVPETVCGYKHLKLPPVFPSSYVYISRRGLLRLRFHTFDFLCEKKRTTITNNNNGVVFSCF